MVFKCRNEASKRRSYLRYPFSLDFLLLDFFLRFFVEVIRISELFRYQFDVILCSMVILFFIIFILLHYTIDKIFSFLFLQFSRKYHILHWEYFKKQISRVSFVTMNNNFIAVHFLNVS